MTTNNPPTLLACLRAIAESGKTERVRISFNPFYQTKDIQILLVDDSDDEYEECYYDVNTVLKSPVMKILLQYCFIQIAKEQGINLYCIYGNSEGVMMLNDSGPVVYVVGKDGIQNMSHALAWGICQSLGLEVGDEN